jgi:diguanylate cyclase (GGDEF)-like protein
MLRVLLIEDNPGDQVLLKAMINEVDDAGIAISDTVDRLSIGLELLATGQFDVVLSDLSLPDAIGTESVEKIIEKFPDLPIVVLTGNTDQKTAMAAVRKGAQDYLVKGQAMGDLIVRSVIYAAERKRLVTEEKRHLRSMASLSQAAIGFVRLDSTDDINFYIAKQLHDLIGGDPVICVSAFDKKNLCYKLQVLFCDNEVRHIINENLGVRLDNISYNFTAEFNGQLLNSCKIIEVESGLHSIIDNESIPDVIQNLENALEIERLMLVSFAFKEEMLGTAIIGMRNGEKITNESALGIFINLAAVALQRRQMECELRSQSIVDELTSLYNRRGFFTLSDQQMKIATRHQKSMMLIFFDLDNLKWINDALGHNYGDEALKVAAEVIRESFRNSDILARIGGDEFVAMVLDATPDDASLLEKRMSAKLMECNREEKFGIKLSISMGYSYFDPFSPKTVDDMLRQADSMMYENKRSKRKASATII